MAGDGDTAFVIVADLICDVAVLIKTVVMAGVFVTATTGFSLITGRTGPPMRGTGDFNSSMNSFIRVSTSSGLIFSSSSTARTIDTSTAGNAFSRISAP